MGLIYSEDISEITISNLHQKLNYTSGSLDLNLDSWDVTEEVVDASTNEATTNVI